MKNVTISLILLSILFSACRKDSIITSPDASVTISADSLKFDTLFTSSGSVTRSFKIINENNQRLLISAIELMGGNGSAFKMNVDGAATALANDLEVEANDSVYVFVQANVDPSSGDLPFIIRDSIRISYNGTQRFVQLEAWGQNAHFMRNTEITGNEVWTNDKPYVILGYLHVTNGATLGLNKGCRLFFHADAPLVVDGTLNINGEVDSVDRVYFQGDRLDEPYRNYPAAWPGIYFGPSSSANTFRYAVLRNAYQAITSFGNGDAQQRLLLEGCIIDNAYDAGIIAVNSNIRAENLLISNCGKGIAISNGGSYEFTHCTVASLNTKYIGHQSPSLSVSNADELSTANLDARFYNCIFWGDEGVVDNEVVTEKIGSDPYSILFDHVLWRQSSDPAFSTINSAVSDADPMFMNADGSAGPFNFRLAPGSAAVDAGQITGVALDLDGKSRLPGIPDLGAYEQ